MSGPRQQDYAFMAISTPAVRFTAVLVLFFSLMPLARSVPLGLVSTDPQDGIAIHGYDPVSYFAGPEPQQGRASFEYTLHGTTWRFSNEGNRAAFADHPDVYEPQFGGYDPVAIARGASVAGNPLIWLIRGQRLYFFYDTGARSEFAANPARLAQTAERRWPQVRQTLP
jgi:YHS domain-containing protein